MSTQPVLIYSQNAAPNFQVNWSQSGRGGGQSFTAPRTAMLTDATFVLSRTPDVTGIAAAMLFAATGTNPFLIGEGAPIATSSAVDLSTVPLASAAPNGAPVTFFFPAGSQPTLLKGVTYFLVMFIFTFRGTKLNQFGNSGDPDPAHNAANLFGSSLWITLGTVDYNLIANGSVLIGAATLTVVTLFGDGTAAIPVRVTLANPALGLSQSQTSLLPNLITLAFLVPTGSGYTLTLDYSDCSGASQHVVSPPFDIVTDFCLLTGGTPTGTCVVLPNFFLIHPGVTSLANLIKWRARPDFHHFSLSKDGPTDTIFALVANEAVPGLPPETLCAILQFIVTFPNGSRQSFFGSGKHYVNSIGLADDFLHILSGQEIEVPLAFSPIALGDYTVDVAVLFDVALPSPRFVGDSLKTIKFTVVL